MDEIFEKKQEIRQGIENSLEAFSEEERAEKTRGIENRIFEFANFLEAKVVLLYMASKNEVRTEGIFKKCFDYNKIVVLPAFETTRYRIKLYKIDNPAEDMILGPETNSGTKPGKM
jgi:5-formyltetrahydrofolate cyclo-ligase